MLVVRLKVLDSPLKKLLLGSGLIASIMIFGFIVGGGAVKYSDEEGSISVSDLYFCIGRSNIYFVVTLGTEDYLKTLGLWEEVKSKLRMAQPFVITANTHVGTIRDLRLDDRVFLRSDGVEYPSLGKPVSLTTHHNTYIVFFPKYDMYGKPLFEREEGKFEVIIRGVDIEERVFTFYHPLPIAKERSLDVVKVMMLVTVAIAGLSLACSPCLLGAMTVGSVAVASSHGPKSSYVRARIRNTILKNTLYFLLALIASYLAIAIVTNVLGIRVERLRPVEAAGGFILLVFGLAFLRLWGPVAMVENKVASLVTSRYPKFSKYVSEDIPNSSLDPKLSSTIGSCLSLVCSTAGAPTLSTSIVLPLMVYAGLTGIEWSFLILVIYLIAVSVPFILVTVGLGEFLITHAHKAINKVLIIDGFLLVVVGILLLLGPSTVLDALSSLIR